MGEAILEAIRLGETVPEDELPRAPERRDLPNGVGPTTDLLKLLLKMRCAEVDVAVKLVASADDVEQIAAFGEDADVPALRSWRREVFGADALRVRDGDVGVAVRKRKLVLLDAAKCSEAG